MRGSRSRGSLETGVIGRLLMIPLATMSRVVSISWERTYSRVSPARTFLTVCICRSQMPPMCEAAGRLYSQRIPLSLSSSWMRPLFHAAISRRSSRSAPMKLVPLSDLISLGSPRRAMNRWRQLMKESASSVSATSMWMARVARQVNRHPYFFSHPLPRFTGIGPK